MNKTAMAFAGVWLWVVGIILMSCFLVDAKDIDIKKHYQYNIVEVAPDDYIILVQWKTGDFAVERMALCKKVLYSSKLNQYLLCLVDKHNSVEMINNGHVIVGPTFTVIPLTELKDRVDIDNSSRVSK